MVVTEGNLILLEEPQESDPSHFSKLSIRFILFVSAKNKGANITLRVKRPLCEQSNMFGARIKIIWEEQLVDPLAE